ncbi:ClbS/DfsB family four-helix bundle protein [Hoeflea olei]|uniref:ClbS/DfsB family four-helix bundle protein n=1 Tax=Hoeflea olei TaxID=1480615 RepID=A0A1C1YVZ1_9HYPH|nr:ClbS/DfsB family four-helix bundle protein [Hoeflea olei]OCW57627.1 hypothetical protein AWJ14_02070 [Hoeflea olei]
MARPTTKAQLINAAETEFAKLLDLVGSMGESAASVPLFFGPGFAGKEAHWARDKNLRDVAVHLHEWHRLLIAWVNTNQAGDAQPFLPAPYSWKTYGDLNMEFWRKHQHTAHADSLRLLGESHRQVMELIDRFSDAELFTQGHFAWTGTTTLGSYCISATSSHYDWAIKKIRTHIRASARKA